MLRLMDVWGDRYVEDATLESMDFSMQLAAREPMVQPSDAAAAAAAAAGVAAAGVAAAIVPAASTTPTIVPATCLPPGGSAAHADDSVVCALMAALADKDAAKIQRGPSAALLGLTAYAPRAATRLRLRIAGAQVVSEPSAQVTHAVLPGSSIGDGSCRAVRAALSRARVHACAGGGGAGGGGGGGVTAWLVGAWLDGQRRGHQGRRAGTPSRKGCTTSSSLDSPVGSL